MRFVKRQRETAEADSLARDLLVSNKDVDHFWKTVHTLNSNSNTKGNVIDDISGQNNIANYCRDHFYKILNTNDCDKLLESLKIFSTMQTWQFQLNVFLKSLQS